MVWLMPLLLLLWWGFLVALPAAGALRGTAVDLEAAFNAFQEAADAADGYALYNLGYMYWKGLYVSR